MAQHGRTQTLLLITKLLNCHESASPFTLIVDSLEQTAKPLLREFVGRASKAGTEIIYVSFETLRKPQQCRHFIRAYEMPHNRLTEAIRAVTSGSKSRHVLVFDTLYPLMSDATLSMVDFLLPLITPTTTMLAVHHCDQPIQQADVSRPALAYAPGPLKLLQYLATSVFTVHSLRHVLAEQQARLRSVAAPVFGIHEQEEGILQGFRSESHTIVIDMEHRRKSGRSVGALFVLKSQPDMSKIGNTLRGDNVVLLDEHPAFRALLTGNGEIAVTDTADSGQNDLSFSLGLTDKQKRDREGVVLPHFDAQTSDMASGEGGRILYDMGAEDDFDEEEDEI